MKLNAFRVLTICLAVIMLIAIGVNAADNLIAVDSKDGIVAQLVTDKQSYDANETVRANLEVTNNTGKRVAISAELQTPDGFTVANAASEEGLLLEAGQTLKLLESTLSGSVQQGADDQEGGQIWIWIILAVVLVAGAVALFLYGKNKKSFVSMLLCVVMAASLILGTAPQVNASRNDVRYSSSFRVSHGIEVDGQEVNVEALISYEVGIPDETEPPTEVVETTEVTEPTEPDNRLKAYYYNDFEDPDRDYGIGATIVMNNQYYEKKTKDDNTYLEMELRDSTAGGYFQADLKDNPIVDSLVVRVDLSTEGKLPVGAYMQYRYISTANHTFMYINEDGTLRIGGTTYEEAKITAGQWLEMTMVFDLSSDAEADYCDVYIKNQHLTKIKLPKHEENYKIPYMRLSLVGKSGEIDNKDSTLLVDNFVIYKGPDILDLADIQSPQYPKYKVRYQIEDTPMEYPELSDLGKNIVAVLAGTDKAYVNGKLITLPEKTKAANVGSVFTDAMVSSKLVKEHMRIAGLSDDRQYSILRYAEGWNVFVDSRGMVILTKDVVLKEKEHSAAITMLYGYLKTGQLVNNYAVAPVLTQSIIDEAVAEFLIPWPTYSGSNYPAQKSIGALYYLVLATHMDETTAASNGTLCKDEAIRRIRFLIAGGNEPIASVGCFWGHGITSSVLVLAKNTPAIWNALTQEEIEKIDLLMECLAIAANWGYNEQNDYDTGFDLIGNFGKDYNPNFLNSYMTCYFSAAMYFGAEELDKIYLAFDYGSYIERLEKAGFKNILRAWTTTDLVGVDIGEYMTNGGEVMLVDSVGWSDKTKPQAVQAGSGAGVKLPWAYKSLNSSNVYHAGDYVEMFIDVVKFTYKWAVLAENRTKGMQYWSHTISGAVTPWLGQMGMMTEFSTSDGGGSDARSRTLYCYLSFQNIVPLYANLKLLGYWDYENQSEETVQTMLGMDRRIMVGTEDLLFKIHEGYIANSGQVEYKEEEKDFNDLYGLSYMADMWRNFHAMGNEDVVLDSNDYENVLAPHAEPKDGITEPPEGAVVSIDKGNRNRIAYNEYVRIDGNCYTSGNLEFDVVIGDDVNETTFDSIVIVDKAAKNKGLSHSPMLISFTDGFIGVYNASGYKQTGIQFGENYRFRVNMTFDADKQMYSVTITQTWPQTKKPISYTADKCVFRLTADDSKYVDSITVAGSKHDLVWVENVKMISGVTRPPSPEKDTYDLTIKNLWDGVPEEKRPDSFSAKLVLNGTVTGRKVTFTKADGWANKVFDNLPLEINKFPVDWGIAVDKIDGYYSTCTGVINDAITISWLEDSLFVTEDFEDGVLDTLIDEGGEWGGKFAAGVIKSEKGNKYLCLENDNLTNQLAVNAKEMTKDLALTGKYNNVILKIDLRLKDAKQVVNGYLNYRKATKEGTTAANSFIIISDNAIKFANGSKTINLGMLTDQWQTLKIWFDTKNNTMMVSFGEDTNFAMMTGMPAIADDQIRLATVAASGALCVDNFLAYSDSEWTMEQNLASMKTAIDVQILWDGVKPADSVVVSLLAGGVPTGKTITLTAANNWTGKFTDLQKYVEGTKEIVYSVSVPPVNGYMGVPAPMVGSLLTVTYAKELHFYSDDFNDQDYGNIKVNAGQLSFGGVSGNYWLKFGGEKSTTISITDDRITGVPSLVMEMKLMIDAAHTGTVMFRHDSTGSSNDKTQIFAVYSDGDMRTGSAANTSFGKLIPGQWTYLKVVMDFEHNTCTFYNEAGDVLRVRKNISDNDGNFIRIWAENTSSLNIDDLKIYSIPVYTGEDTPKQETVAVNVEVKWQGITPTESVKVTLLADGAATDKTLVLNAGNQWKGSFAGLPKYNQQQKEIVYSVQAPRAYGVSPVVSSNAQNVLTVTYADIFWIYNSDFTDENKALSGFAISKPLAIEGFGTDRWLSFGSGTAQIKNDGMKTINNLVLEMKLMVENGHNGMVSFRYSSETGGAKTEMFAVYKDGTIRSGSSKSTVIATLTEGEWIYLKVVLDFNNNTYTFYDENGQVLLTRRGIYPNNADYLNIWAENGSALNVDDLKVYSDMLSETTNKVVSGSIVWVDADNAENHRPDDVKVSLYNGNTLVAQQTVAATTGNTWDFAFTDLVRYDAMSNEILYTVKLEEQDVPDRYDLRQDGNDVVLQYVPTEMIDCDVSLVWNDSNNASGTRPATVEVSVYNNETLVTKTTVTAADGWTKVLRLPKYNADLSKPSYIFVAVAPEGYVSSVRDFVITLSLKTFSVTIDKDLTVKAGAEDPNTEKIPD